MYVALKITSSRKISKPKNQIIR